MKKSFLFSALLAAMMLTGCSESVDVGKQPEPANNGGLAVLGETPVGFSAYTTRGVTRSGLAGLINDEAIQKPAAEGGGFGVFAYYTDLKKYDQTYIPNFMYNQKVEYNSSTTMWEYSPVLYWPNEYGSDAQSDDEDKVSFFAYAPYVEATSPAAGSVENAEWGITGFSRNSTAGDPIVKYIASFDPSKSVDLCWGVVGSADRTWAKIEGSSTQTITANKPWLDVEHPKGIDQKLKFTFLHALSQLNVQIDADPDVLDHDEDEELASGTKIYVRSISFTGIAMQGALNLNNSTASVATWLDYGGTTDLPYGQSVTVMDGRRDGREGTSGAEANNETPSGLNSDIVQSTTWNDANATPGVTHEPKNLFQPSSDDADAALVEPVYVIPTGESMTVTIVYDVETASSNLTSYLSDGTTHGVSVENRITKKVDMSLVNGKKYTLKLHLGMNSVKFDAAVDDWDDGASSDAWLPSSTGEGVYNALNPLTVTSLNGSAPDPAMTGATATQMTITGLLDGGGDPNYADISAGSASDWTMNTTGIIEIASDDGAGTRGILAGTRTAEYDWRTSLSNTTKVKIKPLKAGTVKLTATDHEGNASSCVVVVDAPEIVLDQSSITLYKFTSASENGTVTATLRSPVGSTVLPGTFNDAVTVVTNTYQEFTADRGTALNTAVTLNNNDGASDTYKDKVVTAAINTSTGAVTLTPQGAGTATVTVTSTTGATASFKVTVKIPTFNISTTAITLVAGSSKALTYSGASPAEDDTYSITQSNSNSSVATYDAAKGKVTAVTEGTTTIKFYYDGHEGSDVADNHDPYKECVVTVVATDPVAMKTGDGVMATNPLYKVAQYNVGKPSFEGDGKPTATSFALQTYHSTTAQYVFSFECATDTISAMACEAGGCLEDYHLPTWQEQVAVIPSNTANGAGTNIFAQGTSDPYFQFPQGNTLTAASAAGNDLTSTVSTTDAVLAASGVGFFYRNASNDFYAVRVIGDVATAWHYKYGDYNGVRGLKIDSYVLNLTADEITLLKTAVDADAKFTSTDDAYAKAKVILGALPESSVWNTTPNVSETAEASTTTSYCMRFLPAAGFRRASEGAGRNKSGEALVFVGSYGEYWSATASSSTTAFNWGFLQWQHVREFEFEGVRLLSPPLPRLMTA